VTAAPTPTMIELPASDTPVAVAADMYAQLGLMPIPLYGLVGGRCACGNPVCQERSFGKHPIGEGWEKRASSDPDRVREAFRGHRGNIGLLMGSTHVAIDADGPVGLASLASLNLPETLTARSGSGGEHRIFRFAPNHDAAAVTNRTFLPKLDAKTRNGQVVVAPSVHRSGERYRWILPVMPAVLPDHAYAVLTARAASAERPAHARKPGGGDLVKRARAYLAACEPAVSGAGGHQRAFAAARALVGWTRRGLSESDALALLEEYNRRCDPPWSQRELDHKWAEALKATDIPDIEDRPAPQPVATVTPIRPGVGPAAAPIDWRDRLIVETRGKSQRPAKHAENAIVVVRYHPDWEGRIRLDVHASTITVHQAPWHESDRPAEEPEARPWADADSVRLSAWIRRELGTDLSVEACDRAVMVAAEANTYHPPRDWMSSLTWDGTSRLSTAAARYLGATLPADYDPITWWMTAAVARTFKPGCKADNVLILEGPQGLRKSSALRTLASPAWFSDTPLDLQSKDAVIALQGKLIVELAELESLRRADAARAKSFFSSCVDDYRPPYGRRSIKAPRQCVFAGTVNHGSYLQDTTGNRRYWPVACTRVDLDALEADREQLWAEAVALFLEGKDWWPTTSAQLAACEAAQEPRAEGDEWEGLIGAWLQRHPEARPTVGELLVDVLGIPKDRWTRHEQMRVASALQRLGYGRRQVRNGTDRVWRYHPSVTEKEQ
jgi:hypothetical protein